MALDIALIIEQMTLEQKIGATLTLGFAGTLPRKHIYDYITKYHCGGLRLSPIFNKFGNYIDPITGEVIVNVECSDHIKDKSPAYLNASQYKEILDDLKAVAAKRPLGLPLHFSYDQEGGTSADFNFGGVELFPKPMGIRATGDAKHAYEVAKALSEESLAVGFNFLHSPVLDVNVEPRNPEIYTRAYSDDASVVSEYAIETCKGLRDAGMIASGKHFPGRGASAVDAHYELPLIDVDKETLLNRELKPYRDLIEKELLPSVMIAHSIYPAVDPDDVATVSRKVVTGLLREELGFEGVITTDSMTMGALATRYGVANACAMALEAGCDLILMKAENGMVEETFETIRRFLEEGRITIEELNAKVERILTMKKTYGMFDDSSEKVTTSVKPESVIESIKQSGLGEKIAYHSVLPMNNVKDLTLPLGKIKKVLVIEQLNKNVPNDAHWHFSYLYQQCLKLGANVDCFEIDYMISKEDEVKALERIRDYEAVIVTNFYVRSRTANNDFVKKLQNNFEGPVIIVNNTPYKLSTPDGANNVLTTLATTPENIKAVARIIYEGESAKGVWPLSLTEENVYV